MYCFLPSSSSYPAVTVEVGTQSIPIKFVKSVIKNICMALTTRVISSVVDPYPVRSALFGRIRIRIVTEKTNPERIPGSINAAKIKGDFEYF